MPTDGAGCRRPLRSDEHQHDRHDEEPGHDHEGGRRRATCGDRWVRRGPSMELYATCRTVGAARTLLDMRGMPSRHPSATLGRGGGRQRPTEVPGPRGVRDRRHPARGRPGHTNERSDLDHAGGPARGRPQAVRRVSRGGRHRPGHRDRRVLLAARTVRLGQDDDAAHDRGLRAAHGGPGPARRPGRLAPAALRARRQHRVPGLRAVPAHDRRGQRGLWPDDPEGAAGRAPACASGRGARAWSASRATEDRKPGQLSGGQRQRVALARALVNRPRVLLLDEPLGALDLKLRQEMQIELKAIQHELGITFIYVTHDQDEALAMSDRIAIFDRGRIEQVGLARRRSTSDPRPPSWPASWAPRTCSTGDGRAARSSGRPGDLHGAPREDPPRGARRAGARRARWPSIGRVRDVVYLGSDTRYHRDARRWVASSRSSSRTWPPPRWRCWRSRAQPCGWSGTGQYTLAVAMDRSRRQPESSTVPASPGPPRSSRRKLMGTPDVDEGASLAGLALALGAGPGDDHRRSRPRPGCRCPRAP